jgi:deazaflavin-dependent oxidoreductase (nitroreductase family)
VSGPHNFNQGIIETFRANGGHVQGWKTLLLLTTIGAKSGKERVNPIAYTMDGNHIIIVASKGGAPTHPDWYRNILAHPLVTVEMGDERFQARATVIEGEERARLYAAHATRMPGFWDYERKTDRVIPVVALERIN